MPVLLNLCVWRLTSFFGLQNVWPSGAGEAACKWLCVPALVARGVSWHTEAGVEHGAVCSVCRLWLAENFQRTCTSLGWSSVLLLLGMMLDAFNVLELKQRCAAGGGKRWWGVRVRY